MFNRGSEAIVARHRVMAGESHHGTPWTEREVEFLIMLIRNGRDVGEISIMLRRDPAEVKQEMLRLAIASPNSFPPMPSQDESSPE